MSVKFENNLGEIVLSNNMIADLVGNAMNDCYGVVGMVSRNTADGLVSLLKGDALSKGIRVLSQGNKMRIEVHILVEYGVNIPVICENLIDSVKFALESTTGFRVEHILVSVDGIRTEA